VLVQQIAFNEVNPFPMRVVTLKRQQHMQQLKVTNHLFYTVGHENAAVFSSTVTLANVDQFK